MADQQVSVIGVGGERFPVGYTANGDGVTYDLNTNVASVSVTIGALHFADGADVAEGATTDAPWDYDDAAATVIALLKALSPSASAATLTQVASSITTGVLLAANNLRRGVIIFNDSTASLYIAFAATASLTLCTLKISPGASYELNQPIYRGVISGIWDAANGSARLTQITQ